MKVIISDKHKKDLFVALFQTLKNCSTLVNLRFMEDMLYIQGMDKSHICLFEVQIFKKWFDEYNVVKTNNVCFDTNIFHLIISTKTEGLNIIIHSEVEDNLSVDLLNPEYSKGEFNKYFKIPLADGEYEDMNILSVEYDAEFSISSKVICDIVTQMMTFGSDINIKCSEEQIDLITNGIAGEMIVNIPIDDLTEYSIIEGEEVNLSYSLNYINKMCLTNKISSEIQFFISKDYPMKISYDLGDDSFIMFHIAPKIVDA